MTLNIKRFFFLILIFLIATNVAILLNIPFLRQVFGFLFLTILPGVLILEILKLNKMGSTEKFVLSVGLSVSFLMVFELLVNNLSLYFGYDTPLATIPLLVSFNLSFIVLATIGCMINKEPIFSFPNLNLTTPEKAFLIVPVLFPALSIFGMRIMNTTNNNVILIFLLFLIPAYVIFICVFNQKFPKRLYPVVIFLISISLLLMVALRSNHLIGMDTHTEYYYFRTTLSNLHWSAFGHSTLDACLAISLLPTIYQSTLNINSEFLFKILYSSLFSISPLVIYVLSKRYIGELYGFLTSFFFMSLHNFLLTPLHARTNTAILFFALAMMVLFSDKIDPLKKGILFIIFMASCMISHYSTTYIFFFILLGTFIGVEILSKKYTLKKVVSLTIVILFFSMVFFWYSQVTEAAFNSGVRFIENTFTNLNKFFVEEMRSGSTRSVLGEGIMQKGISHKIEFVFTWLTFAFIGIGIITLLRRYKEMSFPELNFKKVDFLMEKFEVEYFVATLVCSGLLVAVVVLPFVSTGYGVDRAHLLGIVILSVFFVIGGIILSRHLKVRAYLIILLVVIPYFFCTTGVLYQMFSVPQGITLNSEGAQHDLWYVHDREIIAARWLGDRNTKSQKGLKMYSDDFGSMRVRLAYDLNNCPSISSSCFRDNKTVKEGYIYLRYANVVEGKVYFWNGRYSYITKYQHLFVEKNRIYDNGGSEIYE